MIYGRHLTFWVATFLVLVALLWLLHDILLPFVAGIALAYVLAPLANRVERLGVNRTIAALLIVSLLVVTLLALIVLLVPLLMQQGAALITHIPGYFKRIKELIVDSNLPWLNWLDAAEAGKTASASADRGPRGCCVFRFRCGPAVRRWAPLRPFVSLLPLL